MVPYFLLLLLPSVFALFNTRRLSLLAWYFTFVVYVVFVGLRFEVGPDWMQYGLIHTSLANYDFWDVAAQAEPLSYLLFWTSQNLGLDVYLSNVVAALLVLTGVFCFARRTANPWIALIVATPYFIIVMGMSGVRQAMAAGIMLFLFSRWERYRLHTRVLYILAAAMFHTSALVNNIFLVLKMNLALQYKIVLGIVVLLFTFYLSSEVPIYSENIVRYQQRYLEGSFIEKSFGSIYHIAMIAVPATLGFFFRKRIVAHIHSVTLLRFGLYAALSIVMINFVSSTAASRLTVYLYFVPMMVYPALTTIYGKRSEMGLTVIVIAFHFLILATWFTLGNHAFAYIPYKNLLFND
jgi:EpsG family